MTYYKTRYNACVEIETTLKNIQSEVNNCLYGLPTLWTYSVNDTTEPNTMIQSKISELSTNTLETKKRIMDGISELDNLLQQVQNKKQYYYGEYQREIEDER
ncbi:MAG: hypothetical protein ACK5LC_08775 [Coprobacillaceae bacterium]